MSLRTKIARQDEDYDEDGFVVLNVPENGIIKKGNTYTQNMYFEHIFLNINQH